MQGLKDLRSEYTRESLDTGSVSPNPFVQFERWMKQALHSKVPEPTAFSLATVSDSGRPSSRIVLLKGLEDNHFIFFTNYQSAKGKELDSTPYCSMNFFWPELERQVRVEGSVSRLDSKSSDEYFISRPRSSQVGAWASPQSSIIASRDILDHRAREIKAKFKGKDVLPRPHQWGGYRVAPFLMEFWQGRPSRLHDRIQYTLIKGVWEKHRLAP